MNAEPTPRIEDCPRTAEGWIPIGYFDSAFFKECESFLVVLEGKADTPLAELAEPLLLVDTAQYESTDFYDEETGEVLNEGPGRFTGDWRYDDALAYLEPAAFMPLPAIPSREALDALRPRLAA